MLNISTTIQATATVYRKTYTITFKSTEGFNKWVRESRNPEFYGGKKAFIDLTTTRDAEWFGITGCVKS